MLRTWSWHRSRMWLKQRSSILTMVNEHGIMRNGPR